jgi:hypothetical protein
MIFARLVGGFSQIKFGQDGYDPGGLAGWCLTRGDMSLGLRGYSGIAFRFDRGRITTARRSRPIVDKRITGNSA